MMYWIRLLQNINGLESFLGHDQLIWCPYPKLFQLGEAVDCSLGAYECSRIRGLTFEKMSNAIADHAQLMCIDNYLP